MPRTSRSPRLHRHVLVATVALGLLATLAAVGSAAAASNAIKVKVTKKQITISGSATATGDSVQVNFDPQKCAASYSQETKRTKVAFTDFKAESAGHFKFTVKLPVPRPAGDPAGHNACAYLLQIEGQNIKQVATASGKY